MKKSDMPRLKKRKKRHILLNIFLVIIICLFLGVFTFATYIVLNAPDFDIKNLYTKEATVLLYNDETEFARLGTENRELVKYSELPEVFIDAIIATEDSRFFQHDGFDLARFIKASYGHLEGNNLAGGASTITMQLSKNFFTSTEASGIEGIIRKFTDIYMSVFKIERKYTKEEILEYYVNAQYLGAHTYGVKQAAVTYFGKNISDLTLPESAFLAGLFNAPSAYNPYNNIEAAEQRKNQVLELMYKHGYINEEQLNDAKSITVASLIDESNDNTNIYQDFIDTLIDEVIEETGLNPYNTPMIIHTTMDPKVQETLNKIMNNPKNFKNKVIQAGIAITSTENGAILGIGAGRNKTGVRQYNFATMIKRHPGSAIKPFMDYGPLFEYEGATPETTLQDSPYTYSDGTPIKDADRLYRGTMTIKEALAQSRNIPALKAFQMVDKKLISNYVHSFGIDYGENLYESASIGAFNGVSPLTMSAAYGAYARGGYYIKPYAYTKIVYRDTSQEYIKNVKKVKVCSATTAKFINDILLYAINKDVVGNIDRAHTEVAGKTGTSTVGNAAIKQYNLDPSAIMDSWACLYTKEYSVAIWYGYDVISHKYYMSPVDGMVGRRVLAAKISKVLFQTNSKLVTSK
ncbi:MAG: transglycosylase domain-containing protein [Bacilli bacterium]|nr:transglycosylase domain-containing protein [Bacilli bacterium]